MTKRISLLLGAGVSVLVFGAAAYTMAVKFKGQDPAALLEGFSRIPPWQVAVAAVLTLLSYVALIGYDLVALHYIGKRLPLRKVALTSMVSYVLSNNLGFTLITGNAIRYRYYSQQGLGGLEIAKVISMCIATFWVGLAFSGGLALVIAPPAIPEPLSAWMKPGSATLIGSGLIVVVLAYILLALRRRGPLRVMGHEVHFPSPATALAQVLVALVDWVLAGLVLYALLPTQGAPGFPAFFSIFMIAQIAGLLSHVPAGLGVFDACILWGLSPGMGDATLLGILLAYRLIYYLIPLVLGFAVHGIRELVMHRHFLDRLLSFLRTFGTRFVPKVFALSAVIWGIVSILVAIEFTTALDLRWVDFTFTIHILEYRSTSRLFIGIAFLFLALGVRKRSDVIHPVAILVMAVELVLFAWFHMPLVMTIYLFVLLIMFVPSGSHFGRKSRLTQEVGKPLWLLLVGLAAALSAVMVAFFLRYDHIVRLESDLSHSLLLLFVGNTVLLFSVLYLLIKPAHHVVARPGMEEMAEAEAILGSSTSSLANLALLGDKAFLFSASRKSFIMYAVRGRSWVAMGDPIGDPAEVNEVIWKFRELCDCYDGIPIFYEIDCSYLDHYIDLGLGFFKMGEEARVPLDSFSTAGKANQGLRYTMNKLSREGFTFEVIPASQVPGILPELTGISDSWLQEKQAIEKSFSQGRFDPSYISRFDCAIVRKEGVIVAFGNLWPAGSGEELRIDLMRQRRGLPHGIMEFLFVSLMEYGKGRGFRHFNLGIAPLSGFGYHPLASRWDKVCYYIYSYVEKIYNFKGLRLYKDKFSPLWHPVYIAIPVTLAAPWHIFKIALLTSSGFWGVFRK